jgi:hypothetical protein
VSIRVVLDGPPRRSLRAAIRQGGASAAGAILSLVVLVAMWPWIAGSILAFYAFAAWIRYPSQFHMPAWFPVPPYLLPLLWFAVTLVMGWLTLAGERLLTGERRLVLYLRRFGYADSTRTVSAAVARIGGRWRIATLDDKSVVAMGPPGGRVVGAAERVARPTWAIASGLWQAALTIAVLGGLGTIALALTGRGDVLTRFGVRDPASVIMPFAIVILALLGVTLAGLVLGLVFAPFLGAGDRILDGIRAANKSKTLLVTDAESLAVARGMMIAHSRQAISARLFVLKVETEMWQRTVRAVAGDAAVPLIDVTKPTRNIVWEIDQMQGKFGQRCVFIGQYDQLAHLFAIAEPGSVQAQMQRQLDGCQVLAYRTSRTGTRHFARALRATLEAHAPVAGGGRRRPDRRRVGPRPPAPGR